MKTKGKEISKIVVGLVKDASRIPKFVSSAEEELKAMRDARDFLGKEFGCKIKVVVAENSDHPKAKSAMPGKVGILVE